VEDTIHLSVPIDPELGATIDILARRCRLHSDPLRARELFLASLVKEAAYACEDYVEDHGPILWPLRFDMVEGPLRSRSRDGRNRAIEKVLRQVNRMLKEGESGTSAPPAA
jgi:hypothetical protein